MDAHFDFYKNKNMPKTSKSEKNGAGKLTILLDFGL